jgi:hypothetical protein
MPILIFRLGAAMRSWIEHADHMSIISSAARTVHAS